LESAISRPYQTFSSEDLYPTAWEKAAATVESIIINHRFIDGNKRTGFLAILAILNEENIGITAPNYAVYNFIIKISKNKI